MESSIVLSGVIAIMTPFLPIWRFNNDLQMILVSAIAYLISCMYVFKNEVDTHD